MAEGGKSRGSNFAKAELSLLCYSWMHISQDPIVGGAQKNQTFWDRVVVHYNAHRPASTQERPSRSLESKWSELKHDVVKFFGVYANVLDLRMSGSNAEDTLKKAQELYVTKHPKGKCFQHIEFWYLLKDCPRFVVAVPVAMEDMASKDKGKGKGKCNANKENAPPVSLLQPDVVILDSNSFGSGEANQGSSRPDSLQPNGRPIGNKAAKKLRGEECAMRMAACAQRDMLGVSQRRLKLMAEQNLHNLFIVKVADIDEDCREYFVLSRREKLQQWKAKFAHKIEEEDSCARPTTTPISPLHTMQEPSRPEEIDLAQLFREQESSPKIAISSDPQPIWFRE